MDIRKEDILDRMKDEGIMKKDAEKMLGVLLRYIGDCMRDGDDVHLYQFGIFKRRKVDERTAHSPKTGEEIRVAAHYVVRFYPSKSLTDYVNGGKA